MFSTVIDLFWSSYQFISPIVSRTGIYRTIWNSCSFVTSSYARVTSLRSCSVTCATGLAQLHCQSFSPTASHKIWQLLTPAFFCTLTLHAFSFPRAQALSIVFASHTYTNELLCSITNLSCFTTFSVFWFPAGYDGVFPASEQCFRLRKRQRKCHKKNTSSHLATLWNERKVVTSGTEKREKVFCYKFLLREYRWIFKRIRRLQEKKNSKCSNITFEPLK